MEKKTYFSKVFFLEKEPFSRESVLTLDLVQGELSFQRFKYIQSKQVGARSIKTFYYDGELVDIYDRAVPVTVIRNGKNNWKKQYIEGEGEIQEVVFSKGIKLDSEEIAKIKQFCNAEEFEPYRNREMTMWEEGWIGYRDEISMEFYGITDDYIPLLHLPMDYFYDEKHIWPSEKLYRFLNNRYYKKLNEMDESEDNGVKRKKRKKRKNSQGMIEYGGLSLFYG